MTRGAARKARELEHATASSSVASFASMRQRAGEPQADPARQAALGHDFGQVRIYANSDDRPTPAPPAQPPTQAQPQQPRCATPGEARTVELQPVSLRTGPDDKKPTGATWGRRFPVAVTVWGKLGVTVKALSAVTVDTALKTGGATDDEKVRISGLRDGAGVEVFLMDSALGPEDGGGATLGRGSGKPKIVLADRGNSNTLLAHELGHALGLMHPPDGADAGTIMDVSNSLNKANPIRNTMGNYRRINWPAPTGPTCLNPDS